MFNSIKLISQERAIDFIVLTLICGSLVICFKYPDTQSKFLDLAQAGLGGYLALLVRSEKKSN